MEMLNHKLNKSMLESVEKLQGLQFYITHMF